MSGHEHPGGVAFGRIASTIAVRDLPRALASYVGVMGMRVTFENGDPVGFAILERDAAELHLTVARDHRAGSHNVAHLLVTDATELYDHLTGYGIRIVKGLRDADYGLRGFVFADPDGNRIDVGQQLKLQPREEADAPGRDSTISRQRAGAATRLRKHLQ